MSPISVVFVPGFWEGPGPFEGVRAILQKKYGYNTTVIARPSTGHASPNNPTQEDDIEVIRTTLKVKKKLDILINRGHKIILVVHSSGGFVGSNAIIGLTLSERSALGLSGGVAIIVAMTAALLRPAKLNAPPPFWDIKGPHFFCKEPRDLLFGDLSDEEARPWLERLQPEPEFEAWDCPPKFGPGLFEKVPVVYLICRNDKATPAQLQRMWAEMVHADIRECEAGHMVQLSQPQVVVDLIKEAVDSLA
ncbi:MAG: hypothetical protein Q9227_006824 [Pyrenula ochraceoflavens]